MGPEVELLVGRTQPPQLSHAGDQAGDVLRLDQGGADIAALPVVQLGVLDQQLQETMDGDVIIGHIVGEQDVVHLLHGHVVLHALVHACVLEREGGLDGEHLHQAVLAGVKRDPGVFSRVITPKISSPMLRGTLMMLEGSSGVPSNNIDLPSMSARSMSIPSRCCATRPEMPSPMAISNPSAPTPSLVLEATHRSFLPFLSSSNMRQLSDRTSSIDFSNMSSRMTRKSFFMQSNIFWSSLAASFPNYMYAFNTLLLCNR